MSRTNIAIVLGQFDTGLYTVRALARNGVIVYALDYRNDQPGYYSKYGKIIRTSNPSVYPKKLTDQINRLATDAEKCVVFASSDEFLEFLLLHKNEFISNVCSILPEDQVLNMILNKSMQFDLVRTFGIQIPDYISSLSKEFNIKSIDRYPVVIKPVFIQSWKKKFKNKGFQADNYSDLERQIGDIDLAAYPVLIQKIIPGGIENNYECSFYYSNSGGFIQSFTVQKLRQWPLRYGSATLTRTVKNSDVEDASKLLLENLGWKGFANVEFKLDPDDGVYKFIEINARVWQQISHAEALGVNYPLMMFNDCTGGAQLGFSQNYKINSFWLDASSDFLSVIRGFRNRQESLFNILKGYLRADSYGLLSMDDIKPFLNSIGIWK